jgi:pimeloyl-ACP methyl ester carboxylesterase
MVEPEGTGGCIAWDEKTGGFVHDESRCKGHGADPLHLPGAAALPARKRPPRLDSWVTHQRRQRIAYTDAITPIEAAMTAVAAPVQDHTIALNGLRFHYRDWPNPGAQALVLLHGFTGHARSWDTFAAAMQDRYRVLALDQRGHGETQWADAYGADLMVEDVQAFVTALGLKQFVLLGLSMGGRNAYHFAARHPEEVQRLVIVDIGPEIVAAGSTRIQAGVQARDVFDSPEEAVVAARAGNPRAPDDALRHRVTHNLMQRPDGKWTFRFDAKLRAPGGTPPRPEPAAAWALLAKIGCPTLLIRGAESDVLGVKTAARMVREIPDCRLVTVPDSGHSVPLDNPPGFLAATRTFL